MIMHELWVEMEDQLWKVLATYKILTSKQVAKYVSEPSRETFPL